MDLIFLSRAVADATAASPVERDHHSVASSHNPKYPLSDLLA